MYAASNNFEPYMTVETACPLHMPKALYACVYSGLAVSIVLISARRGPAASIVLIPKKVNLNTNGGTYMHVQVYSGKISMNIRDASTCKH